MQEAEMIGYSRQYLESQKFKLVDQELSEKFRSAVERCFGIAELDSMSVIYRLSNKDKSPYEAFVRVFVNAKEMSFESLNKLNAEFPNAFVDAVRTRPKSHSLKITILIATVWLEGSMELEESK